MLSLNRGYHIDVESAYIITLKGNSFSEIQAQNCVNSCQAVGQPFKLWEAFDGTDNQNLRTPEFLKKASWLPWLKVTDHHLSLSEVACALSHISLWAHCMEIDRPILILEHDAIMLKAYLSHPYYNTIAYMGCLEQHQGKFQVVPIPPHGSLNKNRHMILRAHAYAIDPPMAANLFSHVLRHGIHESLDVMIQPELFAIAQPGLYAYDNFQGTTITQRKQDAGKER